MTLLGDALIKRIQEGGTADDVHQLIAEFSAGYPIVNLRQLFSSERDEAVSAGAWIASELGPRVAHLLEDLKVLLNHPSRRVRAYALDAILLAASPSNGHVIAEAVALVDDEDPAVRWKAMNFLARATSQQLRSSIRQITDIGLAARLKWLLDATSADSAQNITERLDNIDASTRRFAAAAAARVKATTHQPLHHAISSADDEISSFAKEWLD